MAKGPSDESAPVIELKTAHFNGYTLLVDWDRLENSGGKRERWPSGQLQERGKQITHALGEAASETRARSRFVCCLLERFSFHILVKEGILFMCMTRVQTGRRLPFDFLNRTATIFFEKFPKAHPPDCFQDLSTLLNKAMQEFATSDEMLKIDNLNRELDDVTENMRLNIESIVDQGEHISLLVDKTENLNISSRKFKSRSRYVKIRSQISKYRDRILIVIFFLVREKRSTA
uniref:V-SNARE coiled-coil homology domain-containing protein n=1 Tax=Spongospora subterranea TaxID=70186 RepID=A0A0H5R4H1_9EUKA|eukprot:CRZ09105.1 hypothetical protein [Spongospora subterranea]